ncbi:MAG: aminoglycoside phosphotransferase family protein, partial [Planctomycetota bacterium]
LLASGTSLGDVDVNWLVVERLQGRPLSTQFDQPAVMELIETLVSFHAATTRAKPIDQRPAPVDWESNVAKARTIVRAGGFADALRWNDALKHVQKAIPTLAARWNARPITVWCHGDLHPGNALRRAGGDRPGACVLIDLAMVHPGHWIEDAVYLERQYWGHAEQLHGIKPVSALARLRRERGLFVEDSYAELAIVRRVLMASLVPLFLDREGNSRYVHGALEMIERYLPQVH